MTRARAARLSVAMTAPGETARLDRHDTELAELRARILLNRLCDSFRLDLDYFAVKK